MTGVDHEQKKDGFDELKFAMAAYDTANVHAMRLWYVASLVCVPILTTAAGLKAIPIEGFDFDVNAALPPLLLILAALNLVFIVAQVSHYRMAYIYSSMVRDRFNDSDRVSSEFTYHDLLLSAPIAGHNRILPILKSFGMKPSWMLTKILKSIVDITFGLFPAFSLGIGLWILPLTSPLYSLIIAVSVISMVASLPIIRNAIKWVSQFKNP